VGGVGQYTRTVLDGLLSPTLCPVSANKLKL